MPPSLADRVRHIRDALDAINRALAGKRPEDFTADMMLRLAVERLLEIICEASRRIPAEVRAREPQIPWRRMVDFGNRLRHAYHRIDTDLVWEIVSRDLPPLSAFVDAVLREEES